MFCNSVLSLFCSRTPPLPQLEEKNNLFEVNDSRRWPTALALCPKIIKDTEWMISEKMFKKMSECLFTHQFLFLCLFLFILIHSCGMTLFDSVESDHCLSWIHLLFLSVRWQYWHVKFIIFKTGKMHSCSDQEDDTHTFSWSDSNLDR